ncbi:MAG TPA: hypothetical protein PK854_04000 [Oscillospiraceae bacterium]|nr:hypothetical protein [Oscillospiraceae bacterium]HPS34410.1 hypothetical protein [Oscillospiraceae bacterium]
MKTKKVFLLIILVALFSFLISCGSDTKEVKEIPKGFIKLSSRGNYPKNSLSYIFEENQVLFYDADGTCIYQSELSKSDFIVKYQDEYYVNEEKYIELFDLVTDSEVVRNLPSGFVNLRTAGEMDENSFLSYRFGETDISFFVAGDCIYQTELSNSDFIVIYHYEYYINYEKYSRLVKAAVAKIVSSTAIAVVPTKPAEFVPLQTELDELQNGHNVFFFETGVSFYNADGVGIYGAAINDPEFLVLYNDGYYVNKEKFQEIVEIADKIVEQRDKIYSLGEEVKLPQGYTHYVDGYPVFPQGYTIKINELKKDTDNDTLNLIKFSVTPTVSENNKKKMFDYIETDKGTIIRDFNFTGADEVWVKVPQGEKINMIFVKSPDYPKAIRKINVS